MRTWLDVRVQMDLWNRPDEQSGLIAQGVEPPTAACQEALTELSIEAESLGCPPPYDMHVDLDGGIMLQTELRKGITKQLQVTRDGHYVFRRIKADRPHQRARWEFDIMRAANIEWHR